MAALLCGCVRDDRANSTTKEQSEGSEVIRFPSEYREFTNYLSLDRVQNDDQIIRLFANDVAMRGPGPDGRLAAGSIIVGEVYKARRDSEGKVLTSALGRRLRGSLALVAVMEKFDESVTQRHPEHLRNGGWEFAAFKPDGAVAKKDLNSCRACHAPLTNRDHVFSFEHLDPGK